LPEDYLVKDGEDFLPLMSGFKVPLRKIKWVEEKDYIGEVRFYDQVEKVWHEFCAHFNKGKLSTIYKTSPLAQFA
jgi:hypothetical protein